MDISVVIAQVLGIFFVVAGIAMVVSSKATAGAIEESVAHKGIMFMWGMRRVAHRRGDRRAQ